MKLSFVYPTIRQGSIDILGYCLKQQEDKTDWELIVVDGFEGRVERAEAEYFLVSHGIPLKAYVKPKEKTFPWSRTGFANALNTGALWASGDYVIFIHDYTFFNPFMVQEWKKALSELDGRTLLHGGSREVTTPIIPDMLGDISTWKEFPEFRYRASWTPEVFELGYFAIPLNFFKEGNGIDERADFCFSFATKAVVVQARELGYALKVDPTLVCDMIDHHMWETWDERKRFHFHSRWRIPGEFSDVPEEPNWTGWGCNPYLFEREWHKIQEEKNKPVKPYPKYNHMPEVLKVS